MHVTYHLDITYGIVDCISVCYAYVPYVFFSHLSGWWFGTCFIFPYIGNVIIPIDELIFFRGVLSTTNQLWMMYGLQDPDHPCMVYLYTYIWVIYGVNVGKYTIYGWSGRWKNTATFPSFWASQALRRDPLAQRMGFLCSQARISRILLGGHLSVKTH